MRTVEEVTIVEQQEEQDAELQERAARRLADAEEDFNFLIDRFWSSYAKAIAGLDEEREALAQEWQSIEQTSQEQEALLPARARVCQYESDVLLIAGKLEESRAKLEEMKAAEEAPRLMRDRQRAIHDRIEAVELEKKKAARRVFKAWYPDCQKLIRPREHGLVDVLLDGLQNFFFQIQDQAGMNGQGLFNITDVERLTSDATSSTWQSAQRWYGGRG